MAINIRETETRVGLSDKTNSAPAKQPYELEVPRTEQEIAALRRKIVTIAQVFSTNGRIRVLPTLTDDESWACSLGSDANKYLGEYLSGDRTTLDDIPADVFQPKVLYYTKGSLANHTLEEILGVNRHEIAHVNHSDFRYLFEGQRFAQSEGYMPLSWMNIKGPLEDGVVNNQEMERSETVREQMQTRYQARLPELEERIPELPVNLQLGKNILYYWASGRSCPTITDQRVISTFEQLRPAIDQVFRSSSASEVEQIIKEKIWPIYKSLEQQAQKDAEKQEIMEQLQGQSSPGSQGQRAPSSGGQPQNGEGGQSQQGQQGGQSQESQSNSQGEGQAATGQQVSGSGSGRGGRQSGGGILERLKQMLGGGKKESNEQSQSSTQPGSPSSAQSAAGVQPAQESPPGQDQQSGQSGRTNQNGHLSEQLRKEVSQDLQQRLAQESSQNVGQLPTDLRNELEQALNALPEELRQQITEAAKRLLEEKSLEEINKEGGMKIAKAQRNQQTGRMELTLNTVSEHEGQKVDQQMQKLEAEEQQAQAAEAAERERLQAEERQRLAEQLARQKELRELKAAGFQEAEREDYSRFRALENTVKPRVPNFIKRLIAVLPKRYHAEYEGHFYTGKRTDVKVLGKKIPVGDYRVQLRKDLRPTEEPRIYVELLIDNSGTMAGEKMAEAVKTAIFFARVLKDLDVPFAIKLLGEKVTHIMDLGQDYDDIRLKIKPKLVQLTTAEEGATDLGSPLIEAHQEMFKSRRIYADSQGMIFLITDGQANSGLTGIALKEKADEIKKAYPIFVFLLENHSNPAFLSAMEAIFGSGFVTMTTNLTQLLPGAEKILLTQMSRLLPRWQT